MRRMQRIALLVAVIAVAPVLAGCSSTSLDPDQWDFFGLNEKKKLTGERKPLFPEGVPGVSQGIPPEFVKGNQPPEGAETPLTALPAEPPKAAAAEEEQPKPKRKAKVAKRKLIPDTGPPAAQAQQPAQQPAQQQPAAWPDQSQQQPPQQQSGAAWPNAAPGNATR
ncbi:MAG TPA: hypothetical protein VGC38_08095 [Pseudolabrys sp.]